MFTILKKEINSFFNSLIAYIIISVYLVITGLFVWVFPDYNVLDYGYADLNTLFSLSPYFFMFLIPAVTMRSFSEEKRSGTLELLLTRPLSDWDIILGKYFACLIIIVMALAPTLLYYYSIYQIGSPIGNIDSAGVGGSYIGLVSLAAVFTSIGIFASSLSGNQITSFIIAVSLCFVLYLGFTSIAGTDAWGRMAYFIQGLGIDLHYQTLSKGLIGSGDILYFLSIIAIMLLATKLKLESRMWN